MYQYRNEERSYHLYEPYCHPHCPCQPQPVPCPPHPPAHPCCCCDWMGSSETVIVSLLASAHLFDQTPTAGAALLFDTNQVILGDAVTHVLGSSAFQLLAPGSYLVTYHTRAAGTNDTPYPIFPITASVGLSVESTLLPESISNATLDDNESTAILSKSTVITIHNPVSLSLININANTTYSETTIAISKIA